MESAKDLISRSLPAIPFDGAGAFYRSPSANDRIPSDWLRPWTSFTTDVQDILQTLDLSRKVNHVEPSEGEQSYIVGNKFGLTTQFVRHVCEPVAKALSVTPLKGILFGDAEIADPLLFDGPDITLFGQMPKTGPENWNRTRRPVIAVGKVKTFWTFGLQYLACRAFYLNDLLEQPIGDLAHQMRRFRLKHGFLTTYNATVFVRRVGDYRFEVSPPIEFGQTGPSVRECFLAFSAIAARDTDFIESDECYYRLYFDPNTPGAFIQPQPQETSTQQEQPETIFSKLNFTSDTVLYGAHGKASGAVKCTRIISRTKDRSKAIMEVTLAIGQRAVAKCWKKEHARSYAGESNFYEILKPQPNESHDYPFFPTVLCYGEIVCSSLFPEGYILVLSWVEGSPLSLHWPWPRDNIKSDPAYDHIREQCREAVAVLRRLGIYLLDSGPHNVLFDRESGRVTIVDFEFYGMCMEGDRLKESLDVPELVAIFGRNNLDVSLP